MFQCEELGLLKGFPFQSYFVPQLGEALDKQPYQGCLFDHQPLGFAPPG